MILVFLLNNWKYVVMGVLFAAASFFYWRAEVWQDRHYEFKAKVEAIGQAAKDAAIAKEMQDKLRKDTADALHKAALADLNATVRRLRDERASRSYLSEAAPGAGSPETTCLATADAERAIRSFVEAASRLVEEGDQARAALDVAKEWARK
jgi:hypothetical protein